MDRVSKESRQRGFTLVEVLVSVAVITLVLAFTLQLLSGTSSTIGASSAQLDSASMARIVLDRFENDFAGAVLNGGATVLSYQGTAAENSAIGFATQSRARGPTTAGAAWTTDTRSAFIGYSIRAVVQNIRGSTTASISCLNRGDGRFTFSTNSIGSNATPNLWDAFGAQNSRIPSDLAGSQTLLNWQVIASGVIRMHVSFILDDGRVVQTPPAYRNFFANGGTAPCIPVAFSSATSDDPARRFVTGVVVGLVTLDEPTRNLAYTVDNDFVATVATRLGRPSLDGETPVQVWNRNLRTLTSNDPSDTQYLFPPIRNNVRFYQRFYAVRL